MDWFDYGDWGGGPTVYDNGNQGLAWNPAEIPTYDFSNISHPGAWDVYREGERMPYGPMSMPPQGGSGDSIGSWLNFLGLLGQFGSGIFGAVNQRGASTPPYMPTGLYGTGVLQPTPQQVTPGVASPAPSKDIGAGQAPQFSANQLNLSLDDYMRLIQEGKL